MKIHEYQAKRFFSRYGIRIPRGEVVFDAEEAANIAERIMQDSGKDKVAIKAQVHVGGRGKGGGVKLAGNLDDVRQIASEMLENNLVTPQTGPEGVKVNRLLIEEMVDIEKQLYVSLLIDREVKKICIMSSTAGGIDIEEVAANAPDKLKKEWFGPLAGLLLFKARNITADLGLQGEMLHKCVKTLRALGDVFIREDCSLVEVNPLVLTTQGEIIAIDAKMTFDDSAGYRHRYHQELLDRKEISSVELQAQENGYSYVGLDGNIGCCVNGAGLAMATMDIIKYKGGEPANFLDVGGGAGAERVMNAFQTILADKNVKAIFVNIFGGILRCDVVAEGIINAAKGIGITVPLVVRLSGAKASEGRKMLDESGLSIFTVDDMDQGAELVVEKACKQEV